MRLKTWMTAPVLAAGLLALGACSKSDEPPASTAEAVSASETASTSEVSCAQDAASDASTVTTTTTSHENHVGGGSDNHSGAGDNH